MCAGTPRASPPLLAASPSRCASGFLARVGLAARDHDPGPAAYETFGDGAPDPPRTAGDDDHPIAHVEQLVVESLIHGVNLTQRRSRKPGSNHASGRSSAMPALCPPSSTSSIPVVNRLSSEAR